MKPYAFITIFGALGVSATHAALLAGDSFATGGNPNYTADADLAGQNPTVSGWTGGWSGSSVTPDVVTTGLNYSGLETSGGAIASIASQGDGRTGRQLSTGYGAATTGTIYISFLLQVASLDNAFRAFELHNGAVNDTNRRLEIGNGGSAGFDAGSGSGGNFGVRLFNNNSFKLNLGTANTAVNLFVLRFDFGTASNADVLTVYRNPTPGLEPMTATGTLANFDMDFDTTTFARFGSTQATWDELRVGDTFASVTPVPEPSISIMALVASVALCIRRRRQNALAG